MHSLDDETLDVIVNLSRFKEAEVRDEYGVTKLIIPISTAGLTVSNAGNINVRLRAIPFNGSSYGATHLLKIYDPSARVRNKRDKDIIGAIYISGKHEYDASVISARKAESDAKRKEKEKENKFKGLEF